MIYSKSSDAAVEVPEASDAAEKYTGAKSEVLQFSIVLALWFIFFSA